MHTAIRAIAVLTLLYAAVPNAEGYGVLSHEAIVDAAWLDSIAPALMKRFPGTSPEDLIKAHAYAYGGCILQDFGYYPFGSRTFSDLTHYVRSGAFIQNLISESTSVNEYAFALGALAHYSSDNDGHKLATNLAVPLLYPKLEKKYGKMVTFEDDPKAHLATEFAFDVVQVARGDYAPKAYHDFIGFEVSKEVLERAFYKTYSIELKDVFSNFGLMLGTYRHGISSLIPNMTKVAWQLKKDEIGKARPDMTRRKFVYNLRRSSYEKEWGKTYEHVGCGAKISAFFLRLIPKVGPFRALALRTPTPQVEDLFMTSFNTALAHYKTYIAQNRAGRLHLDDFNIDTGAEASFGNYKIADQAYAKLIEKLSANNYQAVSPELRANILAFYSKSGEEMVPGPVKAALLALRR